MKCSECGSMNFEDVGYEDGGGDYGDDFTEVWKCCDCGAVTYGADVGIEDVIIQPGRDDENTEFERRNQGIHDATDPPSERYSN